MILPFHEMDTRTHSVAVASAAPSLLVASESRCWPSAKHPWRCLSHIRKPTPLRNINEEGMLRDCHFSGSIPATSTWHCACVCACIRACVRASTCACVHSLLSSSMVNVQTSSQHANSRVTNQHSHLLHHTLRLIREHQKLNKKKFPNFMSHPEDGPGPHTGIRGDAVLK